MLPDDRFCRSALYPNCTKDLKHFDSDALLTFTNVSANLRAISIVSYSMCESDAAVHKYGIHVEEEKNKRLEDPGTNEEKRCYYLGFYSFRARFIHSFNFSYCIATLEQVPEKGFECHFEYRLSLVAEGANARDFKRDERLARTQIADIMFGPVLLPSANKNARLSELQESCMPLRGVGMS